VARMQELTRLGGQPWRDLAVLARRHSVLEPVRALCEHAGIPVRLAGELPALHRIREIDAFLSALKERGRESMTGGDLHALLPARPSPWRELLAELIADWRAELGGGPGGEGGIAVPASDIAEFCWETLAEQRRERSVGDGVLLATLHAAKGLEFPHVLIADGGWDRDPDQAEERRAFYVGMTRARETLTLLELTAGRHPHLPLLARAGPGGDGQDGDWLLRTEPVVDPPPAAVVARRYSRLTPADLDLGYAGRQPPDVPIHRHLAGLNTGSLLGWRAERDTLLLLDADGHPVARLSKRAAADWLPRAERIEQIRILALLRRDRDQDTSDFAARTRCERWEVALPEIRWH